MSSAFYFYDDYLHDTKSAAQFLLGDERKSRTMNNWRVEGRGPKFVKIERKVFYRHRDLIAYIDANTHSNTGEAA